jgi:hypothetical protein
VKAKWPAAGSVRLSLATRVAVSRALARRRQPGGVLAGWSRLALRWRGRVPRLRRAAAGRPTIATYNCWFPAFHLHLTSRTLQPVSRFTAPDPSRLAAAPAARAAFRNGHTTLMLASPSPSAASRGGRQASQGFSVRQVRLSRPQPWVTEDLRHVNRSPISITTLSRRVHRGRGASYAHEPALALRPAAGSEETRGLRHVRTPRKWLLESQPTAPRSPRTPSQGTAARPQTRATHQPAELAWRTLPPVPAAVVDRAAGHAAPMAARPLLAAVSLTPDASHPDTRKDRPAAPSTASVDARLLDRLTDDVIRRVDRRIRIERERRGL